MSRFGGVQSMEKPRTEVMNAFMRGVFSWMSLGLGLTAVVSYTIITSNALLTLALENMNAIFGLMIVELIMVFVLAGAAHKLAPAVAGGLFLLYSAMNGITLTPILAMYTGASVFQAFITTAGMFAVMAIYGLTTKKDLTSWGSFLFMGLIGIIIASVVNIFMQSSMMSFVISGIGVVVFTGLTAYDVQRFQTMGMVMSGDERAVKQATISGALTLYLDFINLFLMILRFMGASRD
ncbi:MAG: Bax inhibitor-1/YccA family protein [Desulfovibrio sp.]